MPGLPDPQNPTALPADHTNLVPPDVTDGAQALAAVVEAVAAGEEPSGGGD